MDLDFAQRLARSAQLVNDRLDSILTASPGPGEIQRPFRLVAAMRHGVLNGGKRLRPFLVLESAALFEASRKSALQLACALECLHCYSLIHDDLPAMDDDDLRRGKPTVHKAFDEATAILAGDALLTLAFELVTDRHCHDEPSIRSDLANLLARAAGQGGMIGGQMLDLAAENASPTDQEIRTMQAMKTGALFRYACLAGAMLGGAAAEDQAAMVRYGETIGLAFQLADDLLDVTADEESLGKAVGKDSGRGKATMVALHGVETAQDMLEEAVRAANQALNGFGVQADPLRQAARFIVDRRI